MLHDIRHFASSLMARVMVAEEGQALVELALVLPLLLVFVFGIVQFSLASSSANDETHLANEVARYAVVNEKPSSETLAKWGKKQLESAAPVLKNQTLCIRFLENQTTGTSRQVGDPVDRKSTRLNSSHLVISYA